MNTSLFDGITTNKKDKYYKRPHHQIFVFDDVVPEDVCERVKRLIDSEAQDETLTNPGTNVQCKSLILNNRIESNLYNTITVIMSKISERMRDYCVDTFSDCGYLIRKIHGPTECHTDSMLDYNQPTVSSKMIRNLTITIALNSDYNGGEFCFPCQNFKIKLKRGQVIAFPPFWTHPHYTNDLHDGTYRYTINTWMHGN